MQQPQLRTAQTEEIATGFRKTLEDVLDILAALRPFGGSLDDVAETCQLALQNPVQLKILLKTVTDKR